MTALARSALDRWLPHYEFAERHEIAVNADARRVDRAIRDVSLADLPLARLLWLIRSLPARTARGGVRHAPHRPFLAQLTGDAGALVVDDRPGEEIVVGITGQFWRLRGSRSVPRPRSTEEFVEYARPDSCKAVMNFLFTPEEGGGTRVSTVTRVHVADQAARRKFRRYWVVVRPFSGLIRLSWLREVKRRAEAAV